MEAFDNELHQHQNDMDNLKNCLECEKPIATDKDFCSELCYHRNQY
jgi:predicted nucleic acid-binding Zn ribbon protein